MKLGVLSVFTPTTLALVVSLCVDRVKVGGVGIVLFILLEFVWFNFLRIRMKRSIRSAWPFSCALLLLLAVSLAFYYEPRPTEFSKARLGNLIGILLLTGFSILNLFLWRKSKMKTKGTLKGGSKTPN